nr:C39 family peptidase [Aquibacillus koreensis]
MKSNIEMDKAQANENTLQYDRRDDMFRKLLNIDNVELTINSIVIDEKVIQYQNHYYIPINLLDYFFGVNVIQSPLLHVVTVNYDEKSINLPLINPFEDEPIAKKLSLDKRANQKYTTLHVDGKTFIPLQFIEKELDYNLQVSYHEKLSIKISNAMEFPLDVPLINQMESPRLYNGCEVTSLAMILQYHGVEVSKNQLADEIATVPLTYKDGLKGHPNEGFVGDMVDGPGLSVYHRPITELAQSYVGEKAVNLTGSEMDTILDYLDHGMPIWVITTSNNTPVYNFETWQTRSGDIEVTYSVHSVVVTGYDDTHIYINDPYGEKNKKVDRFTFKQAWEQMGKQALIIKK